MPDFLMLLPALSLIPVVWVVALLLDRHFGEPTRFHPLVGFGRFASRLETGMNIRCVKPSRRVLLGALACALAIIPGILLVLTLQYLFANQSPIYIYLVDVLVLYWAIGWRSLQDHVEDVAGALAAGDLVAARRATSMIVSRDTSSADEAALTSAALETSLENSSDALFASLFWYAIGGSTMVLVHRLANTLDAMWGYRNQRFNDFGRCAARLDDLLNFLPAQCVSLCYCLLARPYRFNYMVRQIWWRQGWYWKSINAGSVMASGAAALGIRLGGPAVYEGEVSPRAPLGAGRMPQAKDIAPCFRLVHHTLLLWFLVLAAVSILVAGVKP